MKHSTKCSSHWGKEYHEHMADLKEIHRNHGNMWCIDDDERLEQLVDEGHSVEVMAIKLGRTEVAIQCRLEKLDIPLNSKGEPVRKQYIVLRCVAGEWKCVINLQSRSVDYAIKESLAYSKGDPSDLLVIEVSDTSARVQVLDVVVPKTPWELHRITG